MEEEEEEEEEEEAEAEVGQEEAQELVVREIVSRRLSQRQPRKELAAIARRKPSSAAPQAELDESGGGESDRGGDRGVRGGATVSRHRETIARRGIEALEGLSYDVCGNVLLSCEWRCEVISL